MNSNKILHRNLFRQNHNKMGHEFRNRENLKISDYCIDAELFFSIKYQKSNKVAKTPQNDGVLA
jgi:hypothetical protein